MPLVLELMLNCSSKSTLYCVLLMQPSQKLTFRIFAKTQPSELDQHVVVLLLSMYKIQLKFSASLPCCILPAVHLQSPTFYLGARLHLRGRVGTAWELSEQQASYFPPHLCNSKCTASYCIPLLSSVFNFYGLYYNAALSKCALQVSIFFPVSYTATFHYQFSYLRNVEYFIKIYQ